MVRARGVGHYWWMVRSLTRSAPGEGTVKVGGSWGRRTKRVMGGRDKTERGVGSGSGEDWWSSKHEMG